MRKIMFYCILVIAVFLTGCTKEAAENDTTIPVSNTESVAIIDETASTTQETEEVNVQDSATEVQEVEAIVKEFADAYFTADSDTMKKHFAKSRNAEFTVYEEGNPSEVVVNAIKGLDNIYNDIEEKGYCIASVEFKKSEDSDYYIYLSITLIQEADEWKISSYGLEM